MKIIYIAFFVFFVSSQLIACSTQNKENVQQYAHDNQQYSSQNRQNVYSNNNGNTYTQPQYRNPYEAQFNLLKLYNDAYMGWMNHMINNSPRVYTVRRRMN